ncbi:MAG TPA: hypothetical protein VMT91_09320 [Anaerolineales bacterium]|nr:hypothetical protein [Anaerolineales bacterium]
MLSSSLPGGKAGETAQAVASARSLVPRRVRSTRPAEESEGLAIA